MTGWLQTLMLTAFTAGLMGGLHCAAMCGGVACLLGAPRRAPAAPPPPSRWRLAAAFNAGRLLSYMLAGVLAGAAGQAGLLLRGSLPVQQALMLAAGLTLCLMALYLAGLTPLMRRMESAGTLLWQAVEPLAGRLLPTDSTAKALALGTLWGWLPCGMVYAALLLALSSGDALQGAWIMAAFGLGTLPNMLLVSAVAGRMRRAAQCRGARLAAAALLAMAGLYGIVHAMHPALQVVANLCRVTAAD
jgi:uncharacterized protein